MKYSSSNKPLYCPQNQSTWLKGAVKNSTPVGILWHDTAGGNPNISRYVQPDDNAADKEYWLNLLGKNKYANDWNHINHEAGLNCWIGKLADGTISTVQTGPWTTTPWGCGSGSKGSCNGYIIDSAGKRTYSGKHWVQFEICDDKYSSKEYFDAVFEEACQLTAYICKAYNIDPKGSVVYNGVTVPTILCHADSYKLKLGGNHGDVYSWFKVFGKTMDDVRNRVSEILGVAQTSGSSSTFKVNVTVGEQVKIKSGVNTFSNGKTMASWVTSATLYVREIRSDNTVVISTLKTGDITGVVYTKDLVKLDGSAALLEEVQKEETKTVYYRVRKTWADSKSQIGAYKILANAKTNCDKAGPGYHVFDENGNIIYSAADDKPSTPEVAPTPAVPVTPVKTKPGKYSTGSAADIKYIWDFFKAKIPNNDFAVAGIMGNIFAESAFKSDNLQQTYEKSLGYTDSSYTFGVDDGSYKNFVKDSAGYGLVQWTYYTRKQALLDFAVSKNVSIGDLDMQLEFTWKELSTPFLNSVLNPILTAKSVREASDIVLIKFEAPATKDEEATQKLRASYSQKYFDKFHIIEESPDSEVTDEEPPPVIDSEQPKKELEPEFKIEEEKSEISTNPDELMDMLEENVTEAESKQVGNLLLNLIYAVVKIIKRIFGKTE